MLNNWVSDVRFAKGDVESAYTWNDGTGLFTRATMDWTMGPLTMEMKPPQH